MLSFKEYSQLNEDSESMERARNRVKQIISPDTHPKDKKTHLEKLKDLGAVHARAAKYWWQEHGPNIISGYTGAADADKSAPDSGGPAIVHTVVSTALEAREGWKLLQSYGKHVKAAEEAIRIIKNPVVKDKQRALGLSK
jgi:hypothetical protein